MVARATFTSGRVRSVEVGADMHAGVFTAIRSRRADHVEPGRKPQ
jgi:hypothetical protein